MRWLMAAALLIGGWARGEAILQASGAISANARIMTGAGVSSMTYDPRGRVFLCLPDKTGQPAAKPSYLILQASNGKTAHDFHFEVKAQVTLRDTAGREMNSAAPDTYIDGIPSLKTGGTCIEPEAISIGPDGTVYISDGYGPSVYQFQHDGKMIRRISFDGILSPNEKTHPEPTGLCVFPDHQTIGVIFQHDPATNHGMPSQPGSATLVTLDLDSGLPKGMYFYSLSQPASASVTDMAALDQHRILVVENASTGKPAYRAVWLADIGTGSNLLTQDSARHPVDKTLLFTAQNVATGVPSPADFDWAGIAIIPPTYDERITVLIVGNGLRPAAPAPAPSATPAKTASAVPTEFFKIQIPLPSSLPSN